MKNVTGLLLSATLTSLAAVANADVIEEFDTPAVLNPNGAERLFFDGAGIIENQAVSQILGLSIVEGVDGNDVFDLDDSVIRCQIAVPGCATGPAVTTLIAGDSIDGLDAVQTGTAGSDAASAQTRSLGTGTFAASVNDEVVGPVLLAYDWGSVTFSRLPGTPEAESITVDMTYTAIATVSIDSGPTTATYDPHAWSKLQLMDVSSVSAVDTNPVVVNSPYSVDLKAWGFGVRPENGSAVHNESRLNHTVTLSVKPDAPYLVMQRSITGIDVFPVPGDNDFSGIDTTSYSFVDPDFVLNPVWAAANPEIAAGIVIKRSVSSTTVDIDVIPFSHGENYVLVHRWGIVPVALVSTDAIGAHDWDLTSLRFGPAQAKPLHWRRSYRVDVNRDGRRDLIVYFKSRDIGITCGDTEARLIGNTKSGEYISGVDGVRPFPCWRHGY